MCAILQLVSAPLNPIPIAEHFQEVGLKYMPFKDNQTKKVEIWGVCFMGPLKLRGLPNTLA